ncbi:hypothetical protein PILCRDRAFT_85466 [Piloderma croceum F 1598]|uniref:Uncharacterized protein n=1 Tax=Piloderma croceum (strain F 1598) TaxID=765440 RepID=A0A0C3GC26_PILCF|nr:hypothetical protein PILCRDRAFT_85466 [Piloderma croceum F 1598]
MPLKLRCSMFYTFSLLLFPFPVAEGVMPLDAQSMSCYHASHAQLFESGTATKDQLARRERLRTVHKAGRVSIYRTWSCPGEKKISSKSNLKLNGCAHRPDEAFSVVSEMLTIAAIQIPVIPGVQT